MMDMSAILKLATQKVAQNTGTLNLHNADLEQSVLGTRRKVDNLILSRNKLEIDIPDCVLKAIVDVTHVRTMNISINSIVCFERMKRFKNLTKLHASANELKNLDGLKTLSNLKSLNISKNSDLTSLQGLPVNLEEIYASECSIDDASHVFFMKNLRILKLDRNKLKTFERKEDVQLDKLEELDLSYNELTNMPTCSIENLKMLNLSHNKIQTIQGWDFNKNLRQIELHFNEFKKAIPWDHDLYKLLPPEKRKLDFPDLLDIADLDLKSGENYGKLWISNRCALHCTDFLKREKITHIVSIVRTLHPEISKSDYHQKHISLLDISEANIKKHFDDAIEFIHNARLHNHSVLVHCNKGRSRSATIVIAYMIWLYSQKRKKDSTHHEDPETVLTMMLQRLKAKRPIVEPNQGFIEQLLNFIEEIK